MVKVQLYKGRGEKFLLLYWVQYPVKVVGSGRQAGGSGSEKLEGLYVSCSTRRILVF